MPPSLNPLLAKAAEALASSAVFGPLGPQEAARLAAAGALMDLAAGATLVQKGDPGDAAFVVLQGEIEVRAISPGGRQVRLAVLCAGEVAGEMSALDGTPRSADMVATRNTRLLRLGRDTLTAAFLANPAAALALAASLVGRLRATDAELEALRVLDLGGRLATLLAREGQADGLVSLTQTEIARRVGASREKVNRKLHDWAGQGLVSLGRSGVRVLSSERLEALVAQAWAR